MEKITRYNRTTLDNGLIIVSESSPAFYSASIGIWVKCGSRHEEEHENGLSHFIEHMLFKGTEKRSAFDIAWQVDSIGGVLNAFTSREWTCYDIKVLSENYRKAVNILSDLFLNSIFENSEIEKERQVILQEISMTHDTPDDLIHDLFYEAFWGKNSLGRQVTGTAKSVLSFTREDVIDFYKRMYHAGNIIIAAAGNIDHDELVADFSGYFNVLKKFRTNTVERKMNYAAKVEVERKKLEQVHLSMGVPSLSSTSPERYTAYLLSTILGEGMSSRLFQEVRENRGLVYNIYSYVSAYENEGLMGIYAAMGKEELHHVINIVMRELKRLREIPLTDEELLSAKAQMKSNLLMGLENSESIMHRLAVNEITFGRQVPVCESIKKIESVTTKEVMLMADKLFSEDKITLALLGDMDKNDFLKKWEAREVRLS